MRIIHFLYSPAGQGGDILAHTTSLAAAQANSGHEVGLICIDGGNQMRTTPLLAKAEKKCALGVTRLSINSTNIATKLASMLQAKREAVALAGETGADLVHGHGIQGGRLACQLHQNTSPKNPGFLSVYSPHDAPLCPAPPRGWPRLFPEKQNWKHISGLIFNSAHYQQGYEQQNGAPACPHQLIYEGLDEAAFAPRQIIDMASDFLFVGSFNEQGGVETLVQVLGRLKKDYSTGALLVGSGPTEKQVRAQVDRYGLSHSVFFNPSLDLQTAFLKGGCLVLPAHQKSIPLVALQAAAAGVPMILTDTGGVREFIGGVNMPLVAPDEPEALQKQMIDYLQQPQLFLGRAAALKKHISKHFTLARMTAQTEQFYTNLANRS